MANRDALLIRTGQIGDAITGCETAKALQLDFAVSESKFTFIKQLFFRIEQKPVYKITGNRLACDIKTECSIQELKTYKKIYYFSQSDTLGARLFVLLLQKLFTLDVELLHEGSAYFHQYLLKTNKKFVEAVVPSLAEKKRPLNVVIIWSGKETEKSQSFDT